MRRISILSCALLGLSVSAFSQPTRSAPPSDFEVKAPGGTMPSPSPPPQFDLNSLPIEAKQQLLPLYNHEYTLLQQLNVVKWQALQDTMKGLATAGAAMAVSPTAASAVAQESAAVAGQAGASFQGTNAALNAQEPAEMYQSVNRAMNLIVRIDGFEKEISRIQKAYNLDPAIRSPWTDLFPSSKQLTPDEVKKLLAPAATEAAKLVSLTCRPAVSACSCGKLAVPFSVESPSFQAWNRCMDACDARRKSCTQALSLLPAAK
jgi:hypothetical protein